MRKWLKGAHVAPLLLASLPASVALSAPIEGEVVASESRWAYDHSVIVTESVVETRDGARISVQQAGGSVDGIGMRRSHGLPILTVGDALVGHLEPRPTNTGRTVNQLVAVQQLQRHASGAKNTETHEFVRTENTSEKQISWKSGCAILSVAEEGSAQIAGTAEFQVVDQVLRNWNEGSEACSDFALVNEGTTSRKVGFDGHNVIKFREAQWCRPATDEDPQECYDEAAAGITTLYFVDDAGSDRNGEILDADIELNGVQFAFAVGGQSSGTSSCQADFANTLTHEIGHFLGLDHTCWIGGRRLQDDQGNTVPSCTSPTLGDEITEATMYNFQSCGETKKATLEPDDLAGMCAIYPSGEHPTSCKPADLTTGGCCAIAGNRGEHSSNGSTGALALFGFAGLVLAMRRRRSDSAS